MLWYNERESIGPEDDEENLDDDDVTTGWHIEDENGNWLDEDVQEADLIDDRENMEIE